MKHEIAVERLGDFEIINRMRKHLIGTIGIKDVCKDTHRVHRDVLTL